MNNQNAAVGVDAPTAEGQGKLVRGVRVAGSGKGKLTPKPDDNRAIAERLLARGHLIVPILPGEKRPDMKQWQNARLGIGDLPRFRTRGVGVLCGQGAHPLAAFDIDTHNAELAAHMVAWCAEHLGLTVERVGKPPKILLVYRAAEPGWPKLTGDWFVDADGEKHRYEVLGDRQQFVAYHVHPDTHKPYEWVDLLGGLTEVAAADLPVVSLAQRDAFAAEFNAAAERFGLQRKSPAKAPVAATGHRMEPDREIVADGLDAADHLPLGKTLDEARALLNGLNLEDYETWRTAGMALHHEFGGSAEALALWDEASSGCANYKSFDDLAYRWAGFGKAVAAGKRAPVTLRSIIKMAGGSVVGARIRRDEKGQVAPTMTALVMAAEDPAVIGFRLGHDQFRDEIMLAEAGTDDWRRFDDASYVDAAVALEQFGFKRVPREMLRDAVLKVARDNQFDSAVLWLNGLQWDGVPRVERYLALYYSAGDTEYTRAVSLYRWTGGAARLLTPGAQVDMVPVYVGAQGVRKTSGIKAEVPAPEHYVEVSLTDRDDDQARKMRGALVGEIAELRGLGTRDSETIKAFVTRTEERWIPKYREFASVYPRRLLMIGTTNQDEFLHDETGHRRWLPVRVGDVDVDGLKRDMAQLWAEAAVLYRTHGVMFATAEALAREVHAEHVIQDAWEAPISAWLNSTELDNETPAVKNTVQLHEVLIGALGFTAGRIERRHELRAGSTLRKLGYVRRVGTVDGRRCKVWSRVQP